MSIGAHNLRFIDVVDRTGLYTVIIVWLAQLIYDSKSIIRWNGNPTKQIDISGTNLKVHYLIRTSY